VLNNLGACDFTLKKYNDAQIYFNMAQKILNERVGINHPRRQAVDLNLQRLYPRKKKIGVEAGLFAGKSTEQLMEELKGQYGAAGNWAAFSKTFLEKKSDGGDDGAGKKKKKKKPKKKKKGKKGGGGGKDAALDAKLSKVSPEYFRYLMMENLRKKLAGSKVGDPPEPPPPAKRRPNIKAEAKKPALLLKVESSAGAKKKKKKKKK